MVPVVTAVQTDQMAQGKAPISQPLVREGDFAVRLAGALNLGSTASDVEAESILSTAGISPHNGWIADYPVTPDIAGELRTAVAASADNGGLKMASEEALRAFDYVLSGYNLDVRGPGRDDASYEVDGNTAGSSYPDEAVMNSYYSVSGPPVVTYYTPPYDYGYMYSYVPYPFWGWNSFFPGFFVLRDFDRFVFVDRDHDRDFDHHRHGEHFSNHFFDHRRNGIFRINPAHRFSDRNFVGRGVRADDFNTAERSGSLHEGEGRTAANFNRMPVHSSRNDMTMGHNARGAFLSTPVRDRGGDSRRFQNSGSIGSQRVNSNFNYRSNLDRGAFNRPSGSFSEGHGNGRATFGGFRGGMGSFSGRSWR